MRKWNLWGLALLALVAVLVVFPATQAFAQEAADAIEAAADDDTNITVGKVLKWGGIVGWVVIIMSVAMVALAIEHTVAIKRDKIVPPEVIDEIEALFDEQEYQEALEYCESEPNYLTNMLAAALPKMNAGFDVMEESMSDAAAMEATRLFTKVSYLSLIANLAPMCGLFGTVLGMVGAFNKIVQLGPAVTPKDLAAGVQQALITTLFGLVVAIPAIGLYFYFRNRVVRITFELKAIGDDLLERFRPQAG
jgi:biopolymer transport protein ExbB